ncbi:MAG: class II glutamine amidotransferase [Halobacteriovorax sp.]|nr:class II glutamine amidotransferase [Halobacteriovorax sp.]|tara:strand:+ start:18849 stop:19703 length:855 start_codon:yes stop_codon:yes gene_type:complete
MCRLFGFRSVILSQVHSSLVSADNALVMQSNEHPDGWGVGYYVQGTPHIIKSAESSAIKSNLFKKVSGVVSSQTVVAHIRNSTQGSNGLLNTHPFQYGHWVFAHNGNIKDFENYRNQISNQILPELKRFILGDTDSELIFYFILSFLSKKIDISIKDCKAEIVIEAIKEAVKELTDLIGPYSLKDDCGDKETYLTFLLTNGETMVAHQGGKNLYYSTYKTSCGDKDSCPSYSESCENATKDGFINHLIFSSEPLSGENIWIPLNLGQIIGVDGRMKIVIDADDQ